MDMMDSPVTLVIRAPNQRVEDQTVECMLGWTVKKLKQHLQTVYPNKPRETQQKLIYSGKLLNDEQTLKDIIRQSEDTSHHTVHLVCLPHIDLPQESHKKFQSDRKSSPNSSSLSSSSSSSSQNYSLPPPGSSSEGLRHRGHATPSTEASFVPTTVPPQAPVQTPPMMMPPGPDMALTPEQYMMMMQTYYYQMAAQYMQYYQPGGHPTPPPTPAQEEQTNANRVPPNNAANPGAAAANANPVMNAQGGMVDDDDDEDLGPRDWLDYVYTFSRFLVLVSIVYFYSNFTRFLAVCAFFFLVYLYQVGWFNFNRRQNNNRQQAEEQDQAQNNQQQPEQQAEHVQAHNQNENIADQNNADQTQENTQGEQIDNQEPPPPGVLSVAWCFVSTFFSSLIPAPPEPVNAN